MVAQAFLDFEAALFNMVQRHPLGTCRMVIDLIQMERQEQHTSYIRQGTRIVYYL